LDLFWVLRKDKFKLEEPIFSNTEFYYALPDKINNAKIVLNGDESNHLIKVMRHAIDDLILITDGKGNIFNTKLIKIEKLHTELEIIETFTKKEQFPNITFYIPILKTPDRMEFAFEKCIELGITNFVFFNADKGYKKNIKIDRFEKLSIAAMKQSLQANKPKIKIIDKLKIEASSFFIIFEQNAELKFIDYIKKDSFENKINFIFGPEGGLTKSEIDKFENCLQVKLAKNRLRAETAIITAASIIASS
jgi:16S rRNA (uracil1498-N3)-methyltransferase